MEKMLIVDGNSMLFRAFYATIYGRPMTTKDGIYTNGVYGFALMFQKALDMIAPDYVFVAFDAGKHTFRHELYKDYKGGRKKAPDELVPQFQMTRDYLDAYNVAWQEINDIEADDIIGSLSKAHPECEINILSSDKDLLQIIDPTTSVWLMKKGLTDIQKMDEKTLMEEYGIIPKQIIDLKGLMGDSADNIPGVEGIGEKTALKLLNQFSTIENLYDNIDKLKGKTQQKLIDGKDAAFLSKQLATINTDVKLDLDIEKCRFEPNYLTLVDYLNKLEMYNLSLKYQDKITLEKKEEEISYEVVDKLPIDLFKSDIAIYIDSDPDNIMDQSMNGIAFSNGKKCGYIRYDDLTSNKDILAKSRLIGYDVKNDYHLLDHGNLKGEFVYDVMIACFLVDCGNNSWEKIMNAYNIKEVASYKEIYGTYDKPKLADEQEKIRFSVDKANTIYELYLKTKDKLVEYELDKLFYDLEMPLTKVLMSMEKEGICVDEKILDEIALECENKISYLSKQIYAYADHEFNINSPKQLATVLFDELKLETTKKRSTSIEVLQKLSGIHPIIDDLIEYRKWQKIYSTYAYGMKKYIYKDGKIHTTFNQCISETGRLSSSNPNLQNISVRNEEGKMIRKAFLPSKDHVLISSDYSQVELRMLAHMADETTLIEAFNNDMDIHTKTAMDIFNVSADMVDSDMRRKAKAVNFGIIYGMSDFGLAQSINCTRKDAKEYIDNYFNKYPKIKEYMDNIVAYCEKNGYVKTLSNRRRVIPEIYDKSYMVKEFGKRAAMNAPIQGSAADLIKIAMINIDKMMKEKKVKSKMLIQVHDELIFDVALDEIEMMKAIILEGMENAMSLKVKLKASYAVGNSWYEAK